MILLEVARCRTALDVGENESLSNKRWPSLPLATFLALLPIPHHRKSNTESQLPSKFQEAH